MQLSQNLFAEITGVNLGTAAGGEAQADRRLHPRIAFDRRARIFPLMEGAGEGGTAILIRDISVGGVGFLAADLIGVGDEFVIRLTTTTEEPIDLQCAARRCEMGGTCGSQFAVGATFELVLNRPLSASIAPESEMLVDCEPLIDQPAAPTIEQRYDQQCVTSRLLRPIIQETRRDRWLAKPAVRKISRILSFLFWPILAVLRLIAARLATGEESRIRSRLGSKGHKKWRTKSRPAAAVTLPPVDPAPSALEVLPLTNPNGVIFQSPEARPADVRAEVELPPASPISNVVGRQSLFVPEAASTIEPPQILPVIPVAMPIAAPTSIQEPPLVVELIPAATLQPPVQITPPPAPEPQSPPAEADEITNTQAELEVVEIVTPPPSFVPLEVPLHQDDESAETPPSPKNRPPVAHPRQMRRRARSSFHR